MLNIINKEDLLFSDEIEDDRTNTYVNLNDYDWMEYIIKTSFKTETQGILSVVFEYFGMNESSMTVTQLFNDKKVSYEYRYNSNIFQKYIKDFLLKHIEAWNGRYAFNGEDEVLNFYNEVINTGIMINEQQETLDENDIKNMKWFKDNVEKWKDINKQYQEWKNKG